MQRLGPHLGRRGMAQFFCFPDMSSLSILDCASESAQDEFFLRNKHRNIEKENKREREREEKPAEEVLAS